jgi:ribosomal protein S18 acetylase RimI-like enzyme
MLDYIFCDFSDEKHLHALVSLLNEYMLDPMGDNPPLTKIQQLRLVDGLATHPSSMVLFAVLNDEFVGLATCFINFSTFKVAPYINVHDIIVSKEFRNQGIGKGMLSRIVEIARERDYCKVNLEVREDNGRAMYMYSGLGFGECKPPMKFWQKMLV